MEPKKQEGKKSHLDSISAHFISFPRAVHAHACVLVRVHLVFTYRFLLCKQIYDCHN